MAQTKTGNCEVCPTENVNVILKPGNIWMCEPCSIKEDELTAQNNTPEAVQSRVNAVIERAKEIDKKVEVRTDIFNAETVSIVELKKAIEADETIINKPYALAQTIKERWEKLQTVGFELSEKLVEINNQQKAIQVYMNNLANSLRSEEREKLRIQDINYKPQAVKPAKVKTVSTTGTKRTSKIDKVALKKYSTELGIAEFTLQSFVISMGCSVEEAATRIRKSIQDAKS